MLSLALPTGLFPELKPGSKCEAHGGRTVQGREEGRVGCQTGPPRSWCLPLMGAERCGCRQMGPAFLDETGTTCFSSCLLFKGEEELNFQGKGERERLASLSFQTFKGGNSVQVLLDLAGPSWEAGWRQEWKRGLMRDLKTSDKKGCEYARSLASLLPFLISDSVGGA